MASWKPEKERKRRLGGQIPGKKKGEKSWAALAPRSKLPLGGLQESWEMSDPGKEGSGTGTRACLGMHDLWPAIQRGLRYMSVWVNSP